jgi:hypothetical protein
MHVFSYKLLLFLLIVIYIYTYLYFNERNNYLKLKNETKVFVSENYKLTSDLKKMWMEYDMSCYNTECKKDINDKIILLYENAKKKMKNVIKRI